MCQEFFFPPLPVLVLKSDIVSIENKKFMVQVSLPAINQFSITLITYFGHTV